MDCCPTTPTRYALYMDTLYTPVATCNVKMAKQALLDVLEQTIGKYVQNLDAQSLNVAVWSGKIALRDLELNVEAVNAELARQALEAPNLALPIEVKSGKFATLEVDVPWASLTSRSVVLRAQGLHVHVQPCNRAQQQQVDKDVLHASAEERLLKLEQARQKSIAQSEKYRQQAYQLRKRLAAEDEQSSTFTSRLVRRILENIQIEIQDVHVCLHEDNQTAAAGVVLESLSLVTTDAQGNRVFVDRLKHASPLLHKALKLSGLGLYLDHEDSPTERFVTTKTTTLSSIGEESSFTTPTTTLPHSYVLAPLSFQAKLTQADNTTTAEAEHAKYQLSSELSSLSILLSRQQLELARRIRQQVSSSNVLVPLFPEYRPWTRPGPGHSRAWWKYAVRCIGRLTGRSSWREYFVAFQKRKTYIGLYKRHAHVESWLKPLGAAELVTLQELERDRTISIEGIMAWRNIADGQVDMERQKRQAKTTTTADEKSSYFSYIFGSSSSSTPKNAASTATLAEEEPPIQLSLEELKELEEINKEQLEEPASKDSKLYDVQFVLQALRINLTSWDLRHLAALEMGTVAMNFAAAANGAFEFQFQLANLEIQDRVTPQSLFPSVLKNLQSQQMSTNSNSAFELALSKTKTGDQSLKVKLAAFQAVASQMLFRELERFLSASSSAPKAKKKNPILAQSLSGSVDLFYDADQATSRQLHQEQDLFEMEQLSSPRGSDILSRKQKAATATTTTTDLSNVLVDAWKEKTATKAAWIMDVDIKAPLVLIPEKCNDPRASILIFDLGHLKLTYGKIPPSTRVAAWFQQHPSRDDLDASEVTFDSGSLAINELTFKVGRASDWQLLLAGAGASGVGGLDSNNMESSVIDPISLSLDLGVESLSRSAEPPRVCCIGVIPSICLRMSPMQGSKIFAVVGSWTHLLAEMSDERPGALENLEDSQALIEGDLALLSNEQAAEDDDLASTNADTVSEGTASDRPQFFVLVGLQRLSVTVSLDARNRLEAHLVSVYASLQLMNDASMVIGLRMGWFWILDRLESKHTRQQRLMAHSNLPTAPDMYAQDDKYDILTALEELGAFGADYTGSTELADISYRKIGSKAIKAAKRRGGPYVESWLDAKFSSLYIHWNPHAVKGVYGLMDRFYDLADEYEDTSTLIASPERTPRARRLSALAETGKQKNMGQMQIQARMQQLDLNLNSARDDLPLFVLTVSETEVRVLSSEGNMATSLSLGDIRVQTPGNMGKTLSTYRTLLGLAPGRNESLLTVEYVQGRDAVDKLGLSEEKTGKLEAFAKVELSPMRLCFIQSQVMALVEYSTEGILGSITSKAASSAALKAMEIADSVAGKKLFCVHATAFDLVLPQAAYSENTIRIYAGSLDVEYSMFSGTEGSKANVELSDVALHGVNGESMQEKPIRMSLNVLLPSDEVGTVDDQAMRVEIKMSEASFLLQRSQYLQMLRTLAENTGELELYLRDDSFIPSARAVSAQSDSMYEGGPTKVITHAGNQFVEKQRRLYLNVSVEALALQLCDSSLDPIIRLAAVKASIDYQSLPDAAKSCSNVSLRNLVCEDLRKKAVTRQYRFLVRQGISGTESEDLFFVGYESGKNETSLHLKVGSPHVVLIPDAISEVLAFVRSETKMNKDASASGQEEVPAVRSPTSAGVALVTSSGAPDEIETALIATGETFLSKASASTNICRIVLVDLGSQLTRDPGQNTQLTETLVLQGMFSASMSTMTDITSGKVIESEFDGSADAMEIFSAFGRDMRSPLQILEPSQGSAHGSTKSTPYGGYEIEIRAAAMTPFDFTISMHNAALLSAILNSLQASFMSDDSSSGEEAVDLDGLTKGEAEHLEQLASALENTSDRASLGYLASNSSVAGDVSVATSNIAEDPVGTKIQIKLTMPQTKITVINDLQGLDEALFRLSVATFVAGVKVDRYGVSDMTFDFHVNTSILADYFDTSCNIWNSLLVKPWEITLKGLRAPSKRFKSDRLSTTIDLESFPCCISFSEQFLVSLASASRMWSMYSIATAVHLDEDGATKSGSVRASMAASAARNLITSLPYAIENHTGEDALFSLPGENETSHRCGDGSIQYFRFEPPRGGGFGGKRAYGQDLEFEKTVTILWGDRTVTLIGHLDFEFGLPSKTHSLKDGGLVMTHVVKEGKTTVLHLTSHVSVVNNTSLPFEVSYEDGVQGQRIGTCVAHNLKRGNDTPLSTSENGIASKESKSFSIPSKMLTSYHNGWATTNRARLNLSIIPVLPGENQPKLFGLIAIDVSRDELRKSSNGCIISKFDVVCKPSPELGRSVSPLVVQVVLKTTVTADNQAQTDISLEPRALIENKFPVPVQLRSPMPHTFSSAPHEEVLGKDVVYYLRTGDRVEVFTAGPSIAITMKTAESPIAGCDLDWLDGGGWIDLPLVSEFSLLEPIRCILPFKGGNQDMLASSLTKGSEFFIAEGTQSLADLVILEEEGKQKLSSPKSEKTLSTPNPEAPLRTFFVTVCYYGIDHTGDLLFEQVLRSDPAFKMAMNDSFNHDSMKSPRRHSRRLSESMKTSPFSAFASNRHHRRITLLPSGNVPVRILQMTMEGEAGYRRSLPFFVEELPIGDGGISTIPLLWESSKPSGYYAYRSIVNEHQSEIHIVPEFLVFNGSRQIVLVKERGQPEVIIEGSKVSRLGVDTRPNGLEIALYFIELDCRTSFLRVDKLGMKVAILTNNAGVAVGSVCVQTVIDTHGDSRLVVKVGEIHRGSLAGGSGTKKSILAEDFFRFRVRWTELQLILNELQKPTQTSWRSVGKVMSPFSVSPSHATRSRSANEMPSTIQSPPPGDTKDSTNRFNFLPKKSSSGDAERRKVVEILQQPVATIIFSRFTFDFQRVFKEQDQKVAQGITMSPERSQISLIVHNVIIKDLTPDTPFPMVFDSSSPTVSFFDLCIRIRGPLDAEIVKVDLFDLNLAHTNGVNERIKLTTSEDYVWRLLDLANRIMAASGDFSGYALQLVEDEEHGGFIVKIEDTQKSGATPEVEYTPPKSDTLYDIDMARVSPFSLLVSFKRNPQMARYKKVHSSVGGSAMMNYFSRRLKFTIDRAELNFARYEDRSLKGPPDRLFENLFAVYMSRMKFKLVTLLTSASLQDWKFLAARDQGDDEYVEGDILRATGNLTGKASHLIFKRLGQTLGDGVSDITRRFGETIESTSDKIGVGRVGAGVNSVVSGVGDGFGSALTGVGSGTGKILKGAGQGIGHAVGGVAGGALQIGKGIGKGITKGDGKAVLEGFSQGISSVGGGLATGAESAVVGAADGLFSAGRGLFSGVKSVGKGIGGAFTGKKPDRKDRDHRGHD